jgi:hypothetical protein
MTAAIFSVARADHENDLGLVVAFKSGEGWEIDPRFPDSYRCRQRVPPKDFLFLNVIDSTKEIEALEWLRKKVVEFGIKWEASP